MWAILPVTPALDGPSDSHTTPSARLPPSPPGDHCICLLIGAHAPVLPWSLLLSPNRPTQATDGAGPQPRWTLLGLRLAFLPFAGPAPPTQPSFLNMTCLFMLPSVYTRLSPCPGMLYHTLSFSHQLRFLLSFGPHREGSPPVETAGPSLGMPSDWVP